MLRVFRSLLSGLPLIALPAVAAETAVATGITSVGPAVFMFTIGGALFLTLIFRKAATQLAHYFVSRLGEYRIRRALAARRRLFLVGREPLVLAGGPERDVDVVQL